LSDSSPFKTLPLQDIHAEFGARFGDFAGWRMPLWYSGAVAEHTAVRQSAGIFDISHMGRFQVQGNAAEAALSGVFSRDFSRLSAGQSTYALACNQGGGILDDLMVYRLSPQRFVVICNAANQPVIRRILSDAVRSDLLTDLQPQTVLIAVQGPQAVEFVGRILSQAAIDLPRRGCIELEIESAPYFLARTGYTGEDGFEIVTTVEEGRTLFQRLAEAGCTPCGLAARDTLRLEASLPLYGLDIDETTSPWEAGLGWALDLDHDFTGSEALRNLREAIHKRLSCIISDGAGVLRGHQPVYAEGKQVSFTTSGGFSPTLDRSIGMAYLPDLQAEPGARLEVDVRGRRIPCHVVKRPFYRKQSRSQQLDEERRQA
jgi:aminomethyltransferase